MPPEHAPKRSTNDEQNTAPAQRRSPGWTVRVYLEGLRTIARRVDVPCRTRDRIEQRLAAIDEEMATADPVRQVELGEQRQELHLVRERRGQPVDIDALEAAFVAIAGAYSEQHGLSYQSWRHLGVPAEVLQRAGVTHAT